MINVFKRLYNYREFLLTSVKKEIRGKYKKSFLGILWSFLNPLLMLAVYAIIFPLILKVQEKNYVMFLFTAMIPWNFFTAVVTQGSSCIIANGNIIKKVYFPREILPISVVTSGLVNFLISCIIMFVFLIFSGIGFSVQLIYLPLIILLEYIFLLGIVLILSSVTVFLRDLEHIIGVIIQVLFYGTPIVYNLSTLEPAYAALINLNPLTPIIQAYRDILYYQVTPNFSSLGIIFAFSLLLVVVGYMIFNRLQKKFAEEL